MKRGIGVLTVIGLLGALLGAVPAQATTQMNSLCTMGSYSENFPPYRTHIRIGAVGTFVFWLHSRTVLDLPGVPDAEYYICQPLANPGAHALEVQLLTGRAECTAPGTFGAIVNGQIASYELIGQQAMVAGPVLPRTYNFRFWQVKVQGQPGQWTWQSTVVAQC